MLTVVSPKYIKPLHEMIEDAHSKAKSRLDEGDIAEHAYWEGIATGMKGTLKFLDLKEVGQ